MKIIAFLVATTSFVSLAAADISLSDNNETVAVDCAKDPNVSVSGNHTTLTLTGTCTRVMLSGNHAKIIGSAVTVLISGNENTANLDAVDWVATSGNKNTATYKKPVDAKLKKPKISNTGNGNKITKAK